MTRIVINDKFGGFSLSRRAAERLAAKGYDLGDYYTEKLSEPPAEHFDNFHLDISRDHPLLLEVVDELGKEAGGKRTANLKVVEIPDDVEWEIEEYDGNEWVSEKHRVWS